MSKKTTVIISEANRSNAKSGAKTTGEPFGGIAAFISDLKNGIYAVIVAIL